MDQIIAAKVGTQERAEHIFEALGNLGIARSDMETFYASPPGQGAHYAIGGDQDADRGAQAAGGGAVTGAVAGAGIGLAVGAALAIAIPPVGIPIALTAGALVGADLGGLGGALNATAEPGEGGARNFTEGQTAVGEHRGGQMVAVHNANVDQEQAIIDLLRQHGASEIERAHGKWVDGSWVDYNPLRTPQLVSGTPIGAPD